MASGSTSICFYGTTVKPVISDHPFCHWKVVLHDRWSLSRGTISSSLSNKPKLLSTVSFNGVYCLIFFSFWDILTICMLTTSKMFDLNERYCIRFSTILCWTVLLSQNFQFVDLSGLYWHVKYGLLATKMWPLTLYYMVVSELRSNVQEKLLVHWNCGLKWQVVSELRWSLGQILLYSH